MEIKDSGNRRTFANGGVRDMAEGKGACHLLPLDIVSHIYAKLQKCQIFMPYMVFEALDDFVRKGDTEGIYVTIISFSKEHFGTIETALLETAIHYENGAKKYKPRNWELIGETDTFVDSAIRHFLKFLRGDIDEPHDRAFLWNLLGLLWTNEHYKEKADEDTTQAADGRTEKSNMQKRQVSL